MQHPDPYGQHPQRNPRPRFPRDVEDKRCETCNISIRGKEQFNTHLVGSKHQKKVAESQNREKIKQIPCIKFDELTSSFSCIVCNMSMNSSSVAMYHIAGNKHREALKAAEAAGTLPPEVINNSNGNVDIQPEKIPVNKSPRLPGEFSQDKVVPREQNRPFPRPGGPPFNRMRPGGPPFNGGRPFFNPMMPYMPRPGPPDWWRNRIKPLASSFVSKYTLQTNTQFTVTHSDEPNSNSPKGGTFPCLSCNIVANSEKQLQAHLSSEKHRNRLDGNNPQPPPPPPITSSLRCESCNISVNSQMQLDQHLHSAKHRNRVAMRYQPYPNFKPRAGAPT